MVNIKGLLKKSTMVGAAAALTLSLAACSSNSSSSSSSSNSPVNIIVTNGKGEIDAQFKQAAKDFMKANPNIHVDVESVAVGDTLNIYDKLTA